MAKHLRHHQNTAPVHAQQTTVMSAVHGQFGEVAVKSLFTRSAAGTARGSRRVVLLFLPRMHPRNPALRINRATRLRPQRTPRGSGERRVGEEGRSRWSPYP